MQVFNDDDILQKRYEAMHDYCENLICEMENQRLKFERNVAQFLSNRQQIIDNGLNNFEVAVRQNDFDGMSAALNEIAMEFGGELQFKTFEEFDKFMSDENSVLVL